jgi:hypothetical protein
VNDINSPHVLVVDAEAAIRELIADYLREDDSRSVFGMGEEVTSSDVTLSFMEASLVSTNLLRGIAKTSYVPPAR